jgi:hypothetical protein
VPFRPASPHGAKHVQGKRRPEASAMAMIRPFAAFCPADGIAHFFAGTKLPFINASRISMQPRFCKYAASTSIIRRNTPAFLQYWNRRRQVWYGGYRSGKPSTARRCAAPIRCRSAPRADHVACVRVNLSCKPTRLQNDQLKPCPLLICEFHAAILTNLMTLDIFFEIASCSPVKLLC